MLAFHFVLNVFALRVQQLSLRYNGITDAGAETIGAALSTIARQNLKLVSLNLAGNKITDKGASHLAKVTSVVIWKSINAVSFDLMSHLSRSCTDCCIS
jgi:Ran GTPase-activating protein (RanGAP) involved in mRNA processing and transport